MYFSRKRVQSHIHQTSLQPIYQSQQSLLSRQNSNSIEATQQSLRIFNKRRWQSSNSPHRPLTSHPSPIELCTQRTSSFSPIRSHWNYQNSVPFPSHAALSAYSQVLSPLQLGQILQYDHVYFLGFNAQKLQQYTQINGKFKAVIHDHIAYRYQILESLGRGTFGQVLKCYDHKKGQLVTVKVLKNHPKINKSGRFQIQFLQKVGMNDPEDRKCCVRMKSFFDFREHICIVFQILAVNLLEFHRKRRFESMDLVMVRRILVQILVALKYIHSLDIVHCDLKPENIMLKTENKTSIKVIDFGSAVLEHIPIEKTVQSLFYRAPEVILGLPFDQKIDMWSFGCIAFELVSGKPLFTGNSETHQFVKIMEVTGLPSEEMIRNSPRKNEFFLQNWALKFQNRPVLVPKSRKLEEIVCTDQEFIDLIGRCIQIDPKRRFSAAEALEHPWVKRSCRSRNYKRQIYQ